jgi:protein-S-isoprenylcysteine O-methyltransferase Ste14
MNGEQPFRLALLASLLFLLAVGLPHRIRSRTGEPLDRRQEGLVVLITLRLAGLATWLAILAYLVNPSWMKWSSLPMPPWLRWCGLAVGVATGALVSSTLRHLGPNLTDTVVTRRHHMLVTDGPYRWVRNPFYVSAALLTLSAGLLSANGFVFASGAVLIALLAVRTRIEEQKLIERFGEAYRAYMRETPRFIPRPPGLFWRALAAFLVLPGIVAFLIPLAFLGPAPRAGFFDPLAAVPLVCGMVLLLWCVKEFYVAGRGTLAPWTPPARLVVSGPYRFSRNPMYVAVTLILLGWSIAFRSRAHLFYALAIAVMFHLRVILGEEPFLDRTHGETWRSYRRQVRRWL